VPQYLSNMASRFRNASGTSVATDGTGSPTAEVRNHALQCLRNDIPLTRVLGSEMNLGVVFEESQKLHEQKKLIHLRFSVIPGNTGTKVGRPDSGGIPEAIVLVDAELDEDGTLSYDNFLITLPNGEAHAISPNNPHISA